MLASEALQLLKKHWGYDQFLPLQSEAIAASCNERDSLVVLPTGGGKSLCYQIPAMLRRGVTIVVSPLISLMKDQVDALRSMGLPAATLNSTVNFSQQQEVRRELEAGRIKLLYLAPERLLTPQFLELLARFPPSAVAIDEAHCISSWGHDFRPEYRGLQKLRERYPAISWHAYTATATPVVRDDIVQQLRLREPQVLVGDFFRRNLTYTVKRRERGVNQFVEVMERHRGDSGIIYAISRVKVERISQALNGLGFRTRPYHAGLSDQERAANQEALVNDEIEAIVATIAFGMGIDKSNVRYVIHAEMPKSIENYQQESGRAGRDGLASECCLFYSPADAITWERIAQSGSSDTAQQAIKSIRSMQSFCTSNRCRHAILVGHFGQAMQQRCGACDICLGNVSFLEDSLVIGQKILSCVMRCQQNFGSDYITKVLLGSNEARIVQNGHQQLSTWGLMREERSSQIRDWIQQLINEDFLARVGEYSVLKVTQRGGELLRGQLAPQLTRTTATSRDERAGRADQTDWTDVDRDLFEVLRSVRRRMAERGNVPPFVIFSDATLRDLARLRPVTREHLLRVHGVGEKKADDYGEEIMQSIGSFCREHQRSTNVPFSQLQKRATTPTMTKTVAPTNTNAIATFELFRAGLSLDVICEKTSRAKSTVMGYLVDYLQADRITNPRPWLAGCEDIEGVITRVEQATLADDSGRLKIVFDALQGSVSYDHIRIIQTCMRNRMATAGT